MDQFYIENSYSKHTCCLAIGEFSAKGILSPIQLPESIEILSQAIIYEESSGLTTKGSFVRDSACFIVWSLSRFFEGTVMRPFAKKLDSHLLLCSLFDKESNIRRAAAAALQESVGRQCDFEHTRGIEITQEVDYFSVANI